MAKSLSLTSPKAAAVYIFLLAISLGMASSARILDEDNDDVSLPTPAIAPMPTDPVTAPVTNVAPVGSPAGAVPSLTPAIAPVPTDLVTTPVTNVAPVGSPAGVASPITPAAAPVPANSVTTPATNVAPVESPAAGAVTSSATEANGEHPLLTFFMHDILGGSTASARVVTGIVANSGPNGQLPFSKPNGVFPINGGVPLPNGILKNNNLPFLAGLGGSSTTTSTTLQNNGNNNVVNGGNTLPFVAAGQLPAGATLQKLVFGSITVIDDELTEGHELGSSVLGKAQGFYLASSQDGSSQTMALTAILHAEHDEDTISFFGIHRTAAPESHIAIVGGTGKYENAKGYATIETLHQIDQQLTDGVDTILQFSVYISH